ncbi:MAG: Polyketide cyclase / dehydrase and lipid transport [Verrucomicrobiales bacterium]|nr:Polyketide cyclase / dehydrase and lipid transport [Verrucomicrobiales bacterium]
MLSIVLAALGFLLVILLAAIATRPAAFRYTRSTTINAGSALLFDKINDLKKFQTWNPWASVDPSCKMTFEGPPAGVGSSYTWSGNKEVGEGTMTITESKPNELVRARMDFRKPFAATNTVEFTFDPDGAGTRVTWSMFGPNTFMGKAVGLFIDCDKMCGDQFSKGLASLKAESETPVAP